MPTYMTEDDLADVVVFPPVTDQFTQLITNLQVNVKDGRDLTKDEFDVCSV